jgi:cell division protein ZapA (FtsZ GTPase activity inhibitor)
MSDVRVLNILGRDYSIRTTAAEQETLARASQLLHAQLKESQQRFPRATAEELLVLTALNLCVPVIQQDERLDVAERRLSETVLRIGKQLGSASDLL